MSARAPNLSLEKTYALARALAKSGTEKRKV
jgi:hypothetical protein